MSIAEVLVKVLHVVNFVHTTMATVVMSLPKITEQ